MRVWQAAWDTRGDFLIWGESARTPQNPTEAVIESSSSGVHPYACSVDSLTEDLDLLEFDPDESRTIELSLPSDSIGPIPSPRLVSLKDIDRSGEIDIAHWQVPALVLKPVPAIALLTSLPDEFPQGLRFDDSLRYWIEATKMLLDLLTRGRFVPSMARQNGSYFGQWQLVPNDEDDQKRLKVLANCMPPICRALIQNELTPSVEPGVLLESFLSKSADGLIRMFLRKTPLSPEISVDKSRIGPRTRARLSWLESLSAEDAHVEGSVYELSTLEQQLRSWSAPLVPHSHQHALRTCLKLTSPQPTEDSDLTTWTIEFLLQSSSDATQRLATSELWEGELGFLKRSEYSPEDLEEILLKDLARAQHVFPELSRAMVEARPSSLTLDTEEAYKFLRETSVLLENSGFVIELPSWWNQPAAQLGLHLDVNAPEDVMSRRSGSALVGMQQLLDYSWQVSLGDEVLTLDDFKNLVKENTPLINIKGQWVELQQERIESTLRFLEQKKDKPQMRVIDALRIGFGIEGDSSTLPVVGFNASGWIDRLINANSLQVSELKEPEGFIGDLRPYQLQGLSWLAFLSEVGLGGCLADDMGLGKTIQLLALLQHERLEARKHSPDAKVLPTLLAVPMSIIDNWEQEATKFTPELTCYIHHGPTRLSGKAFRDAIEDVDIIITTYSLVHRDEATLETVNWGRIALDEAQNIKNLGTKQTQAVRRLSAQQMLRDESLPLCQRVALTGTPLENHLEELWSIFDFLNPGYLSTVADFRSRFAIPIERYRDQESAHALSTLVQPFILRRLKTDDKVIDELPEKIEMEVFTSLTKEQAALYQSLVNGMLPQVDTTSGIHRKGLVLATITKLKQICNHPALYLKDRSELAGRSGKLSRLDELLDVILAEGDKVLIFTQYAQMGHLLKSHLQERFGREVLFLHGALQKKVRNQLIEKFQTPEGPPIFVLSLKAGGYGLNLTQANQVVHFDQWWNPAVEEQASDRAYRIGQKRNVQVRKFICKGTLEEKIADMLRSKRELARNVVGATKSLITELSTDELRDFLRLSMESLREGTNGEQ